MRGAVRQVNRGGPGGVTDEADFHDLGEVNITGTFHVFESACVNGIKRVVYASSNRATGFYPTTTNVDPDSPTTRWARWRLRNPARPPVARLAIAETYLLAVFDAPVIVMGGLIDHARPQGGQFHEGAFCQLVLFYVPVRMPITWVYNPTRGSLPVVALLGIRGGDRHQGPAGYRGKPKATGPVPTPTAQPRLGG